MDLIDETFLAECGINVELLSDDEKESLLHSIYDDLELRVGARLTQACSPEQMEEYGRLIDRDEAFINDWIDKFGPDFYRDPLFLSALPHGRIPNRLDIAEARAEYAVAKWLPINRPDYLDVVQQELEEMKKEVIARFSAETPETDQHGPQH